MAPNVGETSTPSSPLASMASTCHERERPTGQGHDDRQRRDGAELRYHPRHRQDRKHDHGDGEEPPEVGVGGEGRRGALAEVARDVAQRYGPAETREAELEEVEPEQREQQQDGADGSDDQTNRRREPAGRDRRRVGVVGLPVRRRLPVASPGVVPPCSGPLLGALLTRALGVRPLVAARRTSGLGLPATGAGVLFPARLARLPAISPIRARRVLAPTLVLGPRLVPPPLAVAGVRTGCLLAVAMLSPDWPP